MTSSPYQNIIILLEQYVKTMNEKKQEETKLKLLYDAGHDQKIEYIDKIEDTEAHINFLSSYSRTLMDQAIVIKNEHNVQDVPTIEDIEKNMLLM